MEGCGGRPDGRQGPLGEDLLSRPPCHQPPWLDALPNLPLVRRRLSLIGHDTDLASERTAPHPATVMAPQTDIMTAVSNKPSVMPRPSFC